MPQPESDLYVGPSGQPIFFGRAGGQVVTPASALVTLAGGVPVIQQSGGGGSQTITPQSATVTLAGGVPSILQSGGDNWALRIVNALGADRADGSSYPVSNGSNVPGLFYFDPGDGTLPNISFDPSIKHGSAAGSTRILTPAGAVANSGAIGLNFGANGKIYDGGVVWKAYTVWMQPEWTYQPWVVSGGGPAGPKLSIMSHHAQSHTNNEVVMEDNGDGVWDWYADNQLTQAFTYDVPTVTNCSATDFLFQSKKPIGAALTGLNCDTGVAWSPCEQDRRQKNGLYSARSAANWRNGYGDPFSGAMRRLPLQFINVLMRIARGVSGNSIPGNVGLGAGPVIPGAGTTRVMVWIELDTVPGWVPLSDVKTVETGIDVTYPYHDTLWFLPYMTNRLANTGCAVGSRTGIPGTTIIVVGQSTPTGPGSLVWNASTQLFTWQGNGEAIGTPRGFSAANNILTIIVASGTAPNSFLVITVAPASLPGSGVTTDTVTITTPRPSTQINVNDLIVSNYAIISPNGSVPTGVSTMGDAAANMTAGTWLFMSSITTLLGAAVTGQGGDVGTMMNDCSAWPWNTIYRRIELIGMDHYNIPGPESPNDTQRHYWYDDINNVFVQGTNSDGVMPAGTTPNHGFGHTSVNPYTGDVYHTPMYVGGNNIQLWEATGGSAVFQSQVATGVSIDAQVSIACFWWSGPYTGPLGTLGAQGAHMLFNSGACGGVGTGEMFIYDPLNPGVFNAQTGITPSGYLSDYNSVACYSPKLNCAIYGGGHGGNAQLLYRLNSDGTHTAMPSVPGSGCGLHVGIFVCDPVTGNFLLLTNGALYELNPTGSGTWTLQTGTRAPPSALTSAWNVTVPPSTASGGAFSSLTDYGVIAALFCPTGSASSAGFWLYKHA